MNFSKITATIIISAGVLLASTQSNAAPAAVEGTIDQFSGKPCYQCHASKVKGPGVHGALEGNNCASCHKLSNGNHQADKRYSEVKDRSARLCYGCHADQTGRKSVHPPIVEEQCLGCHAPHMSTFGTLLRSPVEQLCFRCHEQSLVKAVQTATATAFRDGTSNLHTVHAQKHSIPCLTCHDPHAASQPFLLKTNWKNGKELATLFYKGTAKGGNCTTTCHDSMEYVRK